MNNCINCCSWGSSQPASNGRLLGYCSLMFCLTYADDGNSCPVYKDVSLLNSQDNTIAKLNSHTLKANF